MKKVHLKKLALKKKRISDLTGNKVKGGDLPFTAFRLDCQPTNEITCFETIQFTDCFGNGRCEFGVLP